MEANYYTIKQVAAMLDVPRHRITYAERIGALPLIPSRLNKMRIYSEVDVARLREFFSEHRKYQPVGA